MAVTRLPAASALLAASLFALALAAAPALASEPWEANLETNHITVGLDSRITGTPLIFIAEHIGSDQLDNQSMPSEIHLESEKLQVEIDASELSINAPKPAYYHTQYNGSNTYSFNHSLLEGVENGLEYRIMVIPESLHSMLHIESQCTNVVAVESGTISRNPHIAPPQYRPSPYVDLSNSITIKECGQSSLLEFTGNFVISLWDWDFEVTDSSNQQFFETGRKKHSVFEDAPTDDRTISQDQEAWLFVEDGTLSLTLVPETRYHLYMSPDASIHSNSGVLFQDARGHLDLAGHREQLAGNEVYLRGSLDVLLHSTQGGLSADVRGDLEGVVVDQESIALPATVAAPPPAPASLFLSVTSVLLVVVAVMFLTAPQRLYRNLQRARAGKIQGLPGATWRERQGSAFTVMASNALERNRPRRGLVLATMASLFLDHPQILVERARAQHGLGRPQIADRIHRRLDRMLSSDPRERCRNAWHAYQALRASHPGSAESWRRRAEEQDFIEFQRLERMQSLPVGGSGSGLPRPKPWSPDGSADALVRP